MKRRSLMFGLVLAALPLPAWANPAPRWHSVSKRRLGHAIVYGPMAAALRLPVPSDVRTFGALALKLTGGPLRLERVAYLYPLGKREVHRIGIEVPADTILPLPAPRRRPLAVDVTSDIFADGHRYWHLVGTDDPI
jgi:hypothetical protein